MQSRPGTDDTIETALRQNRLDEGLLPVMRLLAEEVVAAEISSGTAISTPAEAASVHVADSLVVFSTVWLPKASRLIDIGTGLGFPGLAIAAAAPEFDVTLLDAARKKAEAAARIARRAGVTNAASLWGRAEELGAIASPHREAYNIVTARALAPLAVLMEYAAPLLHDDGSLIAWKGTPENDEVAACRAACDALSMELAESRSVTPFEGSGERTLWRIRKRGPTPPGFPRRPGVAVHNPLGG